jgi:hypothetical protein
MRISGLTTYCRFDDYAHGYCVALVVMCVLINFGLSAENNDSRLTYIPKQEFIKVIGGILNNETEGGISHILQIRAYWK